MYERGGGCSQVDLVSDALSPRPRVVEGSDHNAVGSTRGLGKLSGDDAPIETEMSATQNANVRTNVCRAGSGRWRGR